MNSLKLSIIAVVMIMVSNQVEHVNASHNTEPVIPTDDYVTENIQFNQVTFKEVINSNTLHVVDKNGNKQHMTFGFVDMAHENQRVEEDAVNTINSLINKDEQLLVLLAENINIYNTQKQIISGQLLKLDETDIGLALVKKGLAIYNPTNNEIDYANTFYGEQKLYRTWQKDAQKERIGIWTYERPYIQIQRKITKN